MSPQPTQAHLDKATCWIVKRPLNVSHQIDSLAQLIADSEARAMATAVTTLTCTNHNDKQRAECPVCLVAALTAELARLRAEVERRTEESKP